ncbi:MAG: lysophospholipid acyltransferase family protein [Candidatus Paceibacterales bacterium]
MLKLISKFIFWISGWKTAGEIPAIKKYVAIYAPHTSGWDLIFGLCGKYIFGIQLNLLAKKEIFVFPIGPILRALGGVPVDRSASHNLVEQAVEMFNQRENFVLALAPEGTRAYAPKWKTGFYNIAWQAKVPILLGYIDYEKKIVGLGPLFYTTGDMEKDIEKIKDFYRPIKGKHPEKGVR